MRTLTAFAIVAVTAVTLAAGSDDTVAATVNGEAIRLADVDAMLARFKPAGSLTVEQTRPLRQAVLDELIDEALLRQYLDKHTPKADAKEIERHVAALVEAQKRQGKTLADFTRETGLTETRLREAFDAMLRLNKHVESRTREADYQAYFLANREVFECVTVRLSHIVIRVGAGAGNGEIAAAGEKLRAMKNEIAAGRISFADAARKHSVCPTAKLGGDLGTIGRKDSQVEEPLAAAAFSLPVNGLSDPIRTTAGLHIIQVTERTAGTPTTYEKCVEAVKEAYADEARNKLILQLRASADLRISLP